jgi:hypothetical protein
LYLHLFPNLLCNDRFHGLHILFHRLGTQPGVVTAMLTEVSSIFTADYK